jgi:YesN/AraC family two-component response regulator
MLDYIHEHYSHPVELHDLAAAMNLNASYVSSLFSTTLGVTFHQYLVAFRLARAKDLLRDPAKRVSEVAYAVGYSNPGHFRNVFTTRIGIPPSAWRQTQAA